jgi:hypothetical protein
VSSDPLSGRQEPATYGKHELSPQFDRVDTQGQSVRGVSLFQGKNGPKQAEHGAPTMRGGPMEGRGNVCAERGWASGEAGGRAACGKIGDRARGEWSAGGARAASNQCNRIGSPTIDRILFGHTKPVRFQLRRPQACDSISHSSPCFANVKVRIPRRLPRWPLSVKESVAERTT